MCEAFFNNLINKTMEKEFTPKPWFQSHRQIPNDPDGMYDTQVYDSEGNTIATLSWHKKEPKKIMIEGSPYTVIGTHRPKNAQLIAAAPDMIDVLLELQETASYWGEFDVPLGIVDRINEAITKAIG
jgi:hypothetical protein